MIWQEPGAQDVGLGAGGAAGGKQVVVYVDNDGSVMMWEKGWSTVCDLCNTLMLAIHQVSVDLNLEVFHFLD